MNVESDILRRIGLAAQAATDKKAFHIVALDVSEKTSFTDAFVLCSAASDRQVDAVVRGVDETLRSAGVRPLHVEGEGHTGWVLMDYGDFIVHVFIEDKRSYYALDALWGDATPIVVATVAEER